MPGVTLEHLATHTSGLSRLPTGLLRQALRHRKDPYRHFTRADLLDAVARARPRRAPGAKVRYSNFGAALIGEVLSTRTGMPYGELVAQRVTAPLGLTETVMDPGDGGPAGAEHRAVGHDRRRRPAPDWDLGAMPGAGALWSTVHDQLRWCRAHLDPGHTPLADALRLVQEPRVHANRWLRLGLGWHVVPLGRTGDDVYWHNGGTGGFFSFVAFVPAQALAVVVLTNTARSVDRIGMDLLQEVRASSMA